MIRHKDFCVPHTLINDDRQLTVGYNKLSDTSRFTTNANLAILNVGLTEVEDFECGQNPLIGKRTKRGL
jgi:hypothetical protein